MRYTLLIFGVIYSKTHNAQNCVSSRYAYGVHARIDAALWEKGKSDGDRTPKKIAHKGIGICDPPLVKKKITYELQALYRLGIIKTLQ